MEHGINYATDTNNNMTVLIHGLFGDAISAIAYRTGFMTLSHECMVISNPDSQHAYITYSFVLNTPNVDNAISIMHNFIAALDNFVCRNGTLELEYSYDPMKYELEIIFTPLYVTTPMKVK